MSEVASYLDRATDDLPLFVLKYPEDAGSALIADGRRFPAACLTPKERWILERVRQHLASGRNVLVFLRHTGKSGLPGATRPSSASTLASPPSSSTPPR